MTRRACALALALAATSAGAAIDATIDAQGRLHVDAQHAQVVARLVASRTTTWRVDAALARQLARADDFFAVGQRAFAQGGVTWLLVVTQTASRANREAGACGAGTEDRLHLVELDRAHARLVERSSLLLQSCLTGLSLDDDTGRSLQQALEAAPDPGHLHLTWLNHPALGDQPAVLSVAGGALRLD